MGIHCIYQILSKKESNICLFIEAFLNDYYMNFKEIFYDLFYLLDNESKELLKYHLNYFKENYSSNYELMVKFYSIFYPIYPNQTLKFIKDWVYRLENEYDINEIQISQYHHNFSNTIELSVLACFYTSYFKIALNISLDIILKQPSYSSEIMNNIVSSFSFKESNVIDNDFTCQIKLIDFLNEKTEDNNKNILKDMILLEIIPKFFDWKHFNDYFEKDTVYIRQFELINCDSLQKLRIKLLNALFKLSDIYIVKFNKIFYSYINYLSDKNKDLYLNEKDLIFEFFNNNNDSYCFSKLIYLYIEKFKKLNLNLSDDFKKLYNIEKIEIAKIYSSDIYYNKDNVNVIYNDLQNKGKKDIIKILDILNEINDSDKNNHIIFYINHIFEFLIENNLSLFNDVFIYYINNCSFNNDIYFNTNLISNLLNKSSFNIKEFYSIINNKEYDERNLFNFIFYKSLPPNFIDEELFFNFIKFLNLSDNFNLYSLDKFFKFNNYYLKKKDDIKNSNGFNNIIQYIIGIRMNKDDFEIPLNCCSENIDYFDDNINLLKKAYFLTTSKIGFDLDLNELKVLCLKDKMIIKEYIINFIQSNKSIEKDSCIPFIWDLKFSKNELDEIFNILFENSDDINNYLNLIFKGVEDEKEIIKDLIKSNLEFRDNIKLIYLMILDKFNQEEFIYFIEFILKLTDDLELFKSIKFEKLIHELTSKSYIEKQKMFYYQIKKVIDKLVNSNFNYIKHVEYLDELIFNLIDREEEVNYNEIF